MGMGYLPQQPTILGRLSVLQNIEVGLKADSSLHAKQIIESFGLTELAHQKGHTLSGGERRRVEISRAFGAQPGVLLVDEPFAGLDPLAMRQVAESLQRLANEGIGVLLSDHDVHQTLEVSDRIYILYEGRLLVSGSPDYVAENPMARERYLGQDFVLRKKAFQTQPEG
jgi:lipopolysaccharide export system ATP-binding protein